MPASAAGGLRLGASAIALYGAWMLATFLLEGLPRTLLRPEAAGLRLTYALVANIGMGVVVSLWLLGRLIRAGALTMQATGFGGHRRTASRLAGGLLLGAALFLAQRPPTRDPMVLINAFSQVLVVSTAEVLVCWAVVGAAVEQSLRRSKVALPSVWAAVAASAAFGVYHFAHSPPFNSVRMVLLLSVVGLVTSVFFHVSRSAYGTILLHNFLGLFGVLDALSRSGRLNSLGQPAIPLIATAIATIVVVVVLDHAWLSSSQPREPTSPDQ